jgi:uncharacterized membrane protein YhaH (DUF805 family)
MSAPQPYSSDATPLDAPLYGASPRDAIRRFFAKYATFTGRASRSEFWWWALTSFVVVLVLRIIGAAAGGSMMAMPVGTSMDATSMTAGGTVINVLVTIWGLGTLVPGLALAVRRLHDVNFSGFFLFLLLIPFVGAIIILVFEVLPSNPAGARFDTARPSPAV